MGSLLARASVLTGLPCRLSVCQTIAMATQDRMALIHALEDYARWLRIDIDRPSPAQVERARMDLMDLLYEGGANDHAPEA